MKRPALLALALLVLWPAPEAAAAIKRHIAFGDSITDGFGDPEGTGYVRRLKRILEKETDDDIEILKSAIPGEETSEALSRISSALAGGGDTLLLMEGTNDVTAISQGRVSLETVIQNLDSLAVTAERRGFEVIHATIFPRSPKALRDSNNLRTQFLTWEIRALAYQKKRRLVDIYEAFDPEIVEDAFELYYFQDIDPVGHPSADGYERIARTFADVMTEVDNVPPVIGTFFPGPLPSEIPPDIEIRVPVYEPLGASGIDMKSSTMLINGRPAGESNGNRRRLEFVFSDAESIGCKVVLGIRSEDRANPENTMDRLLAIYNVTGRSVLAGDVDFDCRVDGFDLVSFAWGFGTQAGDDRYQRRFDLNTDGFVDGDDLAILAKNFSRSSL